MSTYVYNRMLSLYHSSVMLLTQFTLLCDNGLSLVQFIIQGYSAHRRIAPSLGSNIARKHDFEGYF